MTNITTRPDLIKDSESLAEALRAAVVASQPADSETAFLAELEMLWRAGLRMVEEAYPADRKKAYRLYVRSMKRLAATIERKTGSGRVSTRH